MARLRLILVGAWLSALGFGWLAADGSAQIETSFFEGREHPAIGYGLTPPDDPVARLGRALESGAATLPFEPGSGYLRALLRALDVQVDTQLAVFSKTSLQANVINPSNPRTIFFNDAVAVAWPRGGFVEIAAQDAAQGVAFYLLDQREGVPPRLVRQLSCLTCHVSYATLNVPGLLERSVATGPHGESLPFLANATPDHRTPFEERWAGWFVTGSSGTARHLGNQMPPATRNVDTQVPAQATSAASFPDALSGYLSSQSDIVAHLVFDHQIRVVNLLTRAGWAVRMAETDRGDVTVAANRAARELVDALLFVDEAPLPSGIAGNTDFATVFTRRGPSDSKGRSLRTLDLRSRLMRYPCSFMVYAEAFDALPAAALDAVYRRMWAVLSGSEKDVRYARLAAADRRAVVEILRETKKGLPEYFKQP